VDRDPFHALNTHPLVVESLGSSPSRAESDDLVDRFGAELAREGWAPWAVEVAGGEPFVGMVGLHRVNAALPCAPAVEVAWRLHPDHWGHGYASEGAAASLAYGFDEVGLDEIVAFTTTLNVRSQAVMERIGMVHDPASDFDHPGLAADSPQRRHVLYRIGRGQRRVSGSQRSPTVTP
jgi:RimJ/RimL family protein N-acetyltransferase